MSQMIIRLNEATDEIEIAEKNEAGNYKFKKMQPDKFVKEINKIYEKYYHFDSLNRDINLFEEGVIAANESFVVVKQPGCKKMVSFSKTDQDLKFYNINFPNSLYIIHHENFKKIKNIECYAYIEYIGENTKLFEYPMPNELVRNRMCIGNVDRSIKNKKIVEALNRIIYAPYSHSTFQGVSGFSQTEKFFEYLENNEFPYHLIRSLNAKLSSLLH